jgi:transposase-like protein
MVVADFRTSKSWHLSPELCREHGMSSATFYKWRAKYGGMDATMVSRLKELEDENGLLKQLTKALVKPALQAEVSEYLGHDKRAPVTA